MEVNCVMVQNEILEPPMSRAVCRTIYTKNNVEVYYYLFRAQEKVRRGLNVRT